MKQGCAQSTILEKPLCRVRLFWGVLLAFFLMPSLVYAQTKVTTKPSTAKPGVRSKSNQKTKTGKPVDELTRLREEFIKATNEYKASLEKLRASYEKSLGRAEDDLTKSKELFAAGLISKTTVEAGEAAVAQAKE